MSNENKLRKAAKKIRKDNKDRQSTMFSNTWDAFENNFNTASQIKSFCEKAEKLISELQATVNEYQALVGVPSSFPNNTQPTPSISEQPPSQDNTSNEALSDFLTTIGKSVITSQQELDGESMNYLNQLKADKTHSTIIPPTVFRIPKVTASLKLGFEKKKNQKLNVLIYGKEEESTSMNEQSVEMEILAVPASAELLQNMQRHLPEIHFVFNPAERSKIFEVIKKFSEKNPSKFKKHFGKMLEPEAHNKVVFWRVHDQPTQFLVLFADGAPVDETSKDVGIWLVDVDTEAVDAIIRFDLAPSSVTGQKQSLLQGFVNDLANRQALLLNS